MKLIVGITGASGSIYGYSMLRHLHMAGVEVSAVITEMGSKVLEHECNVTTKDLSEFATIYNNNDLFAPIASGSAVSDGMVIIPCSMNTLGSIANGIGYNLLTRAAAVTLKENRRLIAVIRETPLSIINLDNMYRLAKAGACIMPASPCFYNHPTEISQLVDSIVGRVFDQFHIDNQIMRRWGD